MDDREKREFEAGLAADVDAWLKGEPTRRTFITKLGQMTGMLPSLGRCWRRPVNGRWRRRRWNWPTRRRRSARRKPPR